MSVCRSASSTRTTSSPTCVRPSTRPDRPGMSGATRLRLDWPIDLSLTVASHGWANLAPWKWDPKLGRLARPERIGGEPGEIAVAQPDPYSLDVVWEGLD